MSKITQILAGAVFLTASVSMPSLAQETKAGSMVITQSWSRATPGGAKVAAGYLTIENKGSSADRLLGATTDVAGKVELHEMSMNNGIMNMRPVEGGIVIEPGKVVKLAPNGFHIMLLNLKKPLTKGDKVPVTVEFENAGKVTLSLDVQGVGAEGPESAANSGDKTPAKMDMKGHDGMKM